MIPFLIFCLINFGLVMLSKKSFGVTLPVTLTGVTLLTYFVHLMSAYGYV